MFRDHANTFVWIALYNTTERQKETRFVFEDNAFEIKFKGTMFVCSGLPGCQCCWIDQITGGIIGDGASIACCWLLTGSTIGESLWLYFILYMGRVYSKDPFWMSRSWEQPAVCSFKVKRTKDVIFLILRASCRFAMFRLNIKKLCWWITDMSILNPCCRWRPFNKQNVPVYNLLFV